jgi:hypothetical protein
MCESLGQAVERGPALSILSEDLLDDAGRRGIHLDEGWVAGMLGVDTIAVRDLRGPGQQRAPSSWSDDRDVLTTSKHRRARLLTVRAKVAAHMFRNCIQDAVRLYYRFRLSLRDVEELLAERGVSVTYETIRARCAKFGPSYTAELGRQRAQPGDKWHLDEVPLKIKGMRHWLWRAVDQHGG